MSGKHNVDNKNKYCYYINNNKAVEYIFDFSKTIIFVFAVVSFIFTFVIKDANVVGNSMFDTLHNNDKILITNFLYTPKNGDIIAINAENQIEKRIIKRVIATEGQTLLIDYDTSTVYVDGIKIEENYVSSLTKEPKNSYSIPYIIPQGHIFVMGDNRNVSLDSRDADIGLVPIDEVIGKAQFIIFPFDRFSYLY